MNAQDERPQTSVIRQKSANRLTLVSMPGRRSGLYLCECGALKLFQMHQVEAGRVKSCGCLRKENYRLMNLTHGHARAKQLTAEYRSWAMMINRCVNPNNPAWAYYGGRGIAVYAEWINSFEAFLAYVGLKPTLDHSIDRFPNNNGNYEPGNVRWANASEQASNKRNARMLTAFGRSDNLRHWAVERGIPVQTLWNRIKRGIPAEIALTMQLGARTKGATAI